jgi:hypothetical protein
VSNQLFHAAIDGRLTDPAAEPFQPWPTERRVVQWPTTDWTYLYSYHQLLGLRRALWFVTALNANIEDRIITWSMSAGDLPTDDEADDLAGWRGLAITMTALDTVYWVEITQQLSHSLEVWREVRSKFDPAATLHWLGVSLEDCACGCRICRRRWSRRPGVFVNDPAEHVASNKPAGLRWMLDGRRRVVGAALVKRPVRTVPVVVSEILDEHPLELTTVDDQHPIQTLPTQRPDQPFADRVGTR